MESFLNKKYKVERSDNLDELMAKMGVNPFMRKIVSGFSTTIHLTKKGDEYTFHTKISLFTTSNTFRLGEEKEITTADGRRVKNTFTLDGNTLTEKQIGEETLTVVREFFDDEMIATTYYANVVCKSWCKVVK